MIRQSMLSTSCQIHFSEAPEQWSLQCFVVLYFWCIHRCTSCAYLLSLHVAKRPMSLFVTGFRRQLRTSSWTCPSHCPAGRARRRPEGSGLALACQSGRFTGREGFRYVEGLGSLSHALHVVPVQRYQHLLHTFIVIPPSSTMALYIAALYPRLWFEV